MISRGSHSLPFLNLTNLSVMVLLAVISPQQPCTINKGITVDCIITYIILNQYLYFCPVLLLLILNTFSPPLS